jgi:raffinose/stachyose/melibiose transport system substrate-binding protein
VIRTGRIVAVAATIAAALVVGVTAGSAKPSETVTLRLLYNNIGTLAMNTVIANFERVYPDINVEPTYVDGGALTTSLLPQLAAGNAPDLFQTQPGFYTPPSPWALAKSGHLLNLTGSPWQKRVYGPAKQWVWFKDKLYAWPVTLGPHGVAYNVDLFKQLNLKSPKTFAEFVAMCPKITAAGKIPIANGFAGSITTGIVMYQMFSAAFVYNLDRKWDQKRINKQVTFQNSALWRRSLQAIVDLKNAGCFGPAPQGTTLASATQQFARGDAVMSILAYSQIGQAATANPNLNYRVFNLPADKAKDTTMSAAVSQSISIFAKTKHPKEAKTFLNFMARPKQSSLFSKINGGVAPFDAAKGLFPAYAVEAAPTAKAGKLVFSLHKYLNPTIILGPSGISAGIVGLFTGQKTVDQILKDQDYLWANPTATQAP